MNQQTQSKGGWIASFMIVGAVLVLGLLAGLYYLKTRQIEENTPQPVATETQDAEEKDTPEVKAPDSETNKESENKPETEKKEDKEQKAPATDEPKKEETPTATDADEKDTESTPRESLPETGPADVGVQLIALVALSVSSAAYIQSRRGL